MKRCCVRERMLFAPIVREACPEREAALRAGSEHHVKLIGRE